MIYKKISNTFTTVLMGLSCIAVILLYLYLFSKFQENPYFITRARVKVFEEVDFQQVQVSKLMYFLYKNQTTGATDAGQGNQMIISDIEGLCGGPGSYALFPTIEEVQAIRHNVNSVYMLISMIYVFILMLIVTGFNAIYISYFMKEH